MLFLTIQTVVPTRSTPKGSRSKSLFVSLRSEILIAYEETKER